MYQKTVLPNGIRVVTEHLPHVRSVSLGIWFETGSRDEDMNQRGYSHLIEHLVFKGTRRYTARDIAEIMDTSGGHLNAFTGKEHTCYYARILDEHFSQAADILTEMLLHSTFDAREIQKERGVILEEIKMYEDTPDEMVHDLFCEALWPNHALGMNILGTRESISGVGRSELLEFVRSYYSADRLVIAAAGNIDHQQVVDEVAGALDSLNHQSPKTREAPKTQAGQTIVKTKDTEQVHLCVGGPGLSRNDERKYALYILDTITGGGMSSRLFQELREERGLVYSTFSYHSSYADTGSFTLYAGFSPEHYQQVLDVIRQELQSLAREPIGDKELERAKSQLKGSLMLSLESTTNRMTRLARGEMSFGKLHGPDEIAEAVDAVTKEELFALSQELFAKDNLTLAAIGPMNQSQEGFQTWQKIV